MLTDPIADYLCRLRNAQMAGHRMVEIPSSKMKKKMTEILKDQGFIRQYKFDDAAGKQGTIKIALKYNPTNNTPVIRAMGRISKPGLRKFMKADELPRINSGLGIAIVSTSRGVMTDKEARKINVGGEVLCYIY